MPDTFTTTADEVLAGIDLTGRQIVITGATAGLGLAAARAFARAGADIVLIGRDAAKLAAARETVDADGSGTITTEQGDLADLNAVAELAEKLKASLSRLTCWSSTPGSWPLLSSAARRVTRCSSP